MSLSTEIIFSLIESEKEFPIDFDDAWQWIGYSRKDAAKLLLEFAFDKDFDFSIMLWKNQKCGRPLQILVDRSFGILRF